MIARLLLALALLFTGPAFAQQAISNLPQVATPVDADLFPLDVQSYPLGQRTHAVSAAGLARYLLGKIPLGPQGIPGNTGPAGPATQLSIGSTTTGAAGTSALVTIAGQAPAQTLSFTIPTGAAGPQGIAGPTGSTGPAGPQGMVGVTGATGPPNTLSIGTVTTSAPGGPASASVSGAAPNQALNLTLPQGVQGPVGPVGPTGSGQGNVLGPSSATTAGDIAVFSDTTGTRLSDGGTIGTAASKPIAFFLQAGNNLSDLASTAAARTNLGLGGAAVLNVSTGSGGVAASDDSRITGAAQKSANLSDLASATTARTNLGLGTAATQASSFFLQSANNLSDLANPGTARSNLALGTLATQNAAAVAITGGAINSTAIGGTTPAAGAFTTLSASTPLPISSGGTGGSSAATARSGLGAAASGSNSDITSLSGLTTALSLGQGGTGSTSAGGARTALGAAASGANTDITSLASPALGAATATTQAVGDASTKVATDAFVANAIAGAPSGGGAPSAVNALSSAYTVQASDKGKTLLLTGSFTVTEPACSSNSGLYFWVKKADGSGDVLLQPASGTTDGLASKHVYQESFLEWCDGTNWRSQGRAKGWVPIGSTAVASGTAAVNITTAFGDAELGDMQVDYEGVSLSSNGGLTLAVQKNGTYQATGYTYTQSAVNSAGSAVVSSSVATGGPLNIDYNTGTSAARGGDVTVQNFGSTSFQRIHVVAFNQAASINVLDALQTSAFAITGLQFGTSAGTMSAGTFFQKGYRR